MAFFVLLALAFQTDIKAQKPNNDYKLVWEDEFEGLELDMSKWRYRSLGKRRDAFNVQENVNVQNGYLALRTEERKDTVFSAMISTQGKFESTYGYFEIKCLLQTKTGHWSAFWLQTPDMGKHIGDVGKAGAEIDIFEYLPNRPNRIEQTLHYDGYEADHKVKHKSVKIRKFNPSEWHTFGLEWTPEAYTYYVDGKATFKVTEGISHRDQYIILSLEVGEWAGKIIKKNFLDYLIIDYVKVYKK